MSNPQSPKPARWILEMFAPDIPAWNRAFIELERKPLNAYEEMLVLSFDRYLRTKGYLTLRQVEVLHGIATKHGVSLPATPPSPQQIERHIKQEPNPWSALFEETAPREAEVVKPEVLTKWRQWDVPEDIIQRAVRQRTAMAKKRAVEEWINLPNFAYRMPRLREIEANSWGFAKIIDTEGTIAVSIKLRRDKTAKIDGWLYRYTYQAPRIAITTRTYELTEEIANMMHVAVTIRYTYDKFLKRRVLDYTAPAYRSRAVRICYITQPYLTVPEKKRRATEILTTYTRKSGIRTT